MYLLLCIVIIGNDVHRFIVLFFLENIKLFSILRGFLKCIFIEILADSNFCKCLKTVNCSESRVETHQIFYNCKTLRKWSLKNPFFPNRNNLLYEFFFNYSYLWQVIAHFGTFFFMCLYNIKRRQSFVFLSVNQSVYTLTLKQRGLQLRNLLQRYWRGFSKPRSCFFLKNDLVFLE